jgi:hypothetical protein
MHGINSLVGATSVYTKLDSSNERFVNVFGTATGCSITSIGFKTTKGRTFGPWGSGFGGPFSVDGLVLGFYGALQKGAISGLGVWYTPEITFTIPAFLEMTPAYGNLVNVWTWDDTPDMSGVPHLFSTVPS